jgi:hypothetical protein
VEGWHGKLKRNIKSEMKASYSLKGGLLAVLEAHDDYMINASKKAFRLRSFESPLVAKLPAWGFEQLPLPIQQMILEQIGFAEARLNGGIPLEHRVIVPGFELPLPGQPALPGQPVPQLVNMPQCNCRWFEAWQLPCSHIWHHHFLFGSLIPAHFVQLFALWGENGFEIYEEIRRPFAEALDDIIGLPRKVQLDFHELRDNISRVQYVLQQFVEEHVDKPEVAARIVDDVLAKCRDGMGFIFDFNIEAYLQENESRFL